MRKLFVTAAVMLLTGAAFAQTDSAARTKRLTPGNAPRSGDHFMLQLGYTMWQGQPDSINTGGLPRTFNAYFMLDFPFKTNPHWSVALGAGIATDNIYFDKMHVGITEQTGTVRFRDLSDTVHFKKYKLATSYAEVPLELRYRTRPDDDRRSVKFALGVKGGFLLNAHTKGNILENSNGGVVNEYKEKLFSKRFFNTNRIALTGRAGYGHFTLFTSYQVTTLFKEGLGPAVRPMTIGLTISGL